MRRAPTGTGREGTAPGATRGLGHQPRSAASPTTPRVGPGSSPRAFCSGLPAKQLAAASTASEAMRRGSTRGGAPPWCGLGGTATAIDEEISGSPAGAGRRGTAGTEPIAESTGATTSASASRRAPRPGASNRGNRAWRSARGRGSRRGRRGATEAPDAPKPLDASQRCG